MQKVVLDEPYQFIPPLHTNFWPTLVQLYLPRMLRNKFGVTSVECRHADRLKASLDAGHGILLAPNHCRLSDPLVLGKLAREVGTHVFAMASWHLFHQDWFTTFMIRRMGAFSVYREGLDRQALNTGIDILTEAKRPLIIFPEGAISRHNDCLMALMEGTAFLARTAAKRRAKEGGRVVVHPIAIRYYFRGDLEVSAESVLTDIEHRLTWLPQTGKSLPERIRHVAEALLSLKEIEYLGHAHEGNLFERVKRLIDNLLTPLEDEWGIKDHEGNAVARVKRLRTAILPDMINGELDELERERRWRQLAQCYYAQQMSHYPEDYIQPDENIPEHILETIERFEEDLTDEVRTHGPFHVVIEVGEAIEVEPKRDKTAPFDPVMQGIETQLQAMLDGLAREAVRT